MADGPQSTNRSRKFQTHLELAKITGEKPEALAQRIRAGEFPSFGFSGGVFYLPLQAGPGAREVFEKLMAIRHGLL